MLGIIYGTRVVKEQLLGLTWFQNLQLALLLFSQLTVSAAVGGKMLGWTFGLTCGLLICFCSLLVVKNFLFP